MERVIAVISELTFSVKVAGVAKELGMGYSKAREPAELVKELQLGPAVVVVDLHYSKGDPFEFLYVAAEAPNCRRLIAFFSHVQKDLGDRAAEIPGCMAMFRSKFSAELPNLLDLGQDV